MIIWKEAALAAFVEENGVGFTVSSLSEIQEKLERITDDDYAAMLKNVQRISKRLTGGWYTKTALGKCGF